MAELERYYCEAERKLGVFDEPGPSAEDARSEPYPNRPLAAHLQLGPLERGAERSGIPFWNTPVPQNTVPYDGRAACVRGNTCAICPNGARYSPDFTFLKLLDEKAISIHPGTLAPKRIMAERRPRIVAADAVEQDEPVTFRTPVFVLASGHTCPPHRLLLSAKSRFPNGLANSTGKVGRHMTGHCCVTAQMEVPFDSYRGIFDTHALLSRHYFRSKPGEPYVRHALRIWESTTGREPRLKNGDNQILFGDDLLNDGRSRATPRGYYDTHPDRDRRLTLNPATKSQYGHPLPKIEPTLDAAARRSA